MKNKSVNSRKLRYGGVTAALTALVIAAIILFNVVFTLLASKFTWYIDLTPDYLYTLSDAAIELIDKERKQYSKRGGGGEIGEIKSRIAELKRSLTYCRNKTRS